MNSTPEETKNILYRLRKKAGITQTELAERTGISQAEISILERLPNFDTTQLRTLQRVAKGLGKRVVVSFKNG